MLMECPVCLNGSLNGPHQTQPFEEGEGECWVCGFAYLTVQGRKSFDDLNKIRELHKLKPITLDEYKDDFDPDEFSGQHGHGIRTIEHKN